MQETADIAVIGGGIVGCATAYKLSRYFPDKKIVLIEKEKQLSAHQTGRNSGVIHSGIYYKPGSYKAINCVKGRRELVAFAKEHNIPHDVCGKIIVATNESELPQLNKVFQNGIANGVEGIEMIDSKRIKEIEPYCEGIQAIYVPCTGIIDFPAAARKMAELMEKKNDKNKILLDTEVIAIIQDSQQVILKTNQGEVKAQYVVVCGGLQADRLAGKEVTKKKVAIVGFRGDYYDLTPEAQHKVKNLIYPVPNPQFPFLGVHFTANPYGSVYIGPTAMPVFGREHYGMLQGLGAESIDILLKDVLLFFKNSSFRSVATSEPKKYIPYFFYRDAKGLVKKLSYNDIEKTTKAGIRPQLVDWAKKELVMDFCIYHDAYTVHVLNAISPAFTSSLYFAKIIVDRYCR